MSAPTLPFTKRDNRDKGKRRIYNAEYRAANRDELTAQKREHYKANIELMRAKGREFYRKHRKKRLAYAKKNDVVGLERRREKKTGMSPQMFADRLREQCGACPICGVTVGLRSAADHDHARMIPRGVLCHHCNKALGGFRDDIGNLLRAIDYLSYWRQRA